MALAPKPGKPKSNFVSIAEDLINQIINHVKNYQNGIISGLDNIEEIQICIRHLDDVLKHLANAQEQIGHIRKVESMRNEQRRRERASKRVRVIRDQGIVYLAGKPYRVGQDSNLIPVDENPVEEGSEFGEDSKE